jgi:outer membrane lipase/esterase
MAPLMPLAWLLAACSGGGGDAPAQPSSAPTPTQPGPAPAPAAAPVPPSSLFVLGDSLSDVGNVAAVADYALNQPIDPPTVGLCNPTEVLVLKRRCDDLFYLESRVSDGPVAIERLAADLGLPPLRPSLHVLPNQPHVGTVYAVAGAKARGASDADLKRQVDWLLVDHALLPQDAIYVVMIGGNDAFDALQADAAMPAAPVKPSAAVVTNAVNAIGTQVERLLDFGARHVIVANVPDLAALPSTRVKARASADEAAALAAATAISVAFNDALDAKLDAIEAKARWVPPTPVIVRFDLNAALSVARGAIAANGGNAADACFASDVYRDSPQAPRVFHPDCAPETADGAPRFSRFAFWDDIHPTGALHAILGDALHALL